ncbi:MAG: histidine kinase, partial [Burkholderiales bacterium]|nr:histidine kinase [Burkholderiales bacterium]
LRNPLSCIKMSLQMLGAQDKEDWEEAERELKQIALEQVRYMEELMSDLLSYSRPE